MKRSGRQTERKYTFFLAPFSRSLLESGVQDPSHNPTRHYKFHPAAPDVFLSVMTFTAFPHTEVVKNRLIYTLDDKYSRLVTLLAILSSMEMETRIRALMGTQRKLLTNAWPVFLNECHEVKLMCASEVE